MSSVIAQQNLACPVCGYRGVGDPPYASLVPPPVPESLLPPYGQHFGEPSYEICDCCGFEFGFDDEPGTGEPSSFRQYREEWIANGAQWFTPAKKRADWKLELQLLAACLKT